MIRLPDGGGEVKSGGNVHWMVASVCFGARVNIGTGAVVIVGAKVVLMTEGGGALVMTPERGGCVRMTAVVVV